MVDFVVDGRRPRTVVSFSWSDGSLGLLVIVMADDAMSKDKLEELNKELNPLGAMLMNSGHDNHFFTGALTLRYLNEAAATSFRRKREQLKLTIKEHKGLLIADAFAGNRDVKFSDQLGPHCYCSYLISFLKRTCFLDHFVFEAGSMGSSPQCSMDGP